MKYRAFGGTGIEVSEIAFGGGFVGGILLDADDETRRAAIRQALDRGVNWRAPPDVPGGARWVLPGSHHR